MLGGNVEQLWNLRQTDATEGLTFGDYNAALKFECCLLKSITTGNSVKIKLSEKVDISKFMREIVWAVISYTHFIPDIFVDIFRRYISFFLLFGLLLLNLGWGKLYLGVPFELKGPLFSSGFLIKNYHN